MMDREQKMQKAPRAESLLSWISVTSTVVISALILWRATGSVPSFDGAMMLNLARHFEETGKYGYFYNTFFAFPSQTDGLIVLLAAALFKIFGVKVWVAALPNVIFFLLLILTGWAILARVSGWFAAGALIIMLAFVPGFLQFGFCGYGEVPVIALAILCILLATKSLASHSYRHAIFAGVSIGLALTIKVMALFFIAPIVLIVLIYTAKRHLPVGITITAAASSLLPPAAWEVFRFSQLGISGYKNWWKLQIQQIFIQSGASASLAKHSMHLVFDKARANLMIDAGFWGMPNLVFISCIGVTGTLYIIYRFGRKQEQHDIVSNYVIDTIAAIALFIFVWWTFILDPAGAWERRALALNCCIMLLSIMLYFRYANITESIVSRLGALLLSAVLIAMLLASSGKLYKHLFLDPAIRSKETAEVIQSSQILQKLPLDSKIFGFGWWQAPQLALFSGRSIYNLNHWLPRDLTNAVPFYLVSDYYAQNLAAGEIASILKVSHDVPVFQSRGAKIWKVIAYKGIPQPGVELHDAPPEVRSRFKIITRSYALYPDFWVGPSAVFLIHTAALTKVSIGLFIPIWPGHISGRVPQVRIEVGRCPPVIKMLDIGTNNLVLPLGCAGSHDNNVRIVLTSNFILPFVHQIDSDNRALSYVLSDFKIIDARGK
jgi:hypothetical protein